MFWRLPRYSYTCIVFVLSFIIFQSALNEYLVKRSINKKIQSNEIVKVVENPLHLLNMRVYPEVRNYELKDWHDYKFMKEEARRQGPGENGTAVLLTSPEDLKINDELRKIEGLNVYVSDQISVNRSLPDVRHRK